MLDLRSCSIHSLGFGFNLSELILVNLGPFNETKVLDIYIINLLLNIYIKFHTKMGFEPTVQLRLRDFPQNIWNPRCTVAVKSVP